MRLTKVLLAATLPIALSMACGGSASDSGSGDGDGDNASTGDGDGDGDGSPSSSGGKDEVCDQFCDTLATCDGVNVEECVDSCTGDETTSVAGQEAINQCFDADLCENISEEAVGLGLICLLGESDDIDISDEAQTYCDDSVDAINGCLGSAPDPADALGSCETLIGLASDELLADLNECAELPCDEVESCVEITALTSLPIEAILELEGGGEPSPTLIAQLLPVLVVFGQLGLDENTGGDLFGDLGDMMPPDAMGGAAGR